ADQAHGADQPAAGGDLQTCPASAAPVRAEGGELIDINPSRPLGGPAWGEYTMLARLLALMAIAAAFESSARAAVIAEESFDYKPNSPIAGANGGMGWDGAWFGSPLHKNDNQVIGPGLSFANLTSAGNKMRQVGNDVRSFRKIDTSRREVAALV